MLDHIKLEADFTTTCLTTFRTGLPGDGSTQRTLYQFFRTKKHVLDAKSRKKLYPFAWGNRNYWFKPDCSNQISTAITIRNSIIIAVLFLVMNSFSQFPVLKREKTVAKR